MQKILLITRPIAPPWDEASKNFAFDLAKKIASEEEMELHVLTNGLLLDFPKKIIQEPIYTHSQNDFNFSQKIKLFKFLLFNANKFQIIHLLFTPTKTNIFLIKLCLYFSKAKTIQTIATLREDIFSDQQIKKLMFADLIITYSDYAKNKLKKLNINNVKRIYPGIDLSKYSFQEKNRQLLKKFGFSLNDFIVHFSGEYVRLGAIDDVIEGFIEVSQKISSAKLFLAVRVKNEKDAQKKTAIIEKLKNANLLEKTAFFDDGKYPMEDIYNLTDLSLFPVQDMRGKFDVPLVVIEAMACEKPVILSNIPILEEFANSNNSVTIPKGNIPYLSEKIWYFYSNKDAGKSLGKKARVYVEENFDIKNISEKYKDIYKSLN